MSDHDPLCPVDPQLVHLVGDHCFWCEVIAKVRADEREQMQHVDFYAASVARRVVLADLRAKVEALPRTLMRDGTRFWETVLLADVVALFDGGSDD